MPQLLTLAGVEAELYPDRAEFRKRGSKNKNRNPFRRRQKGSSLLGRTTSGKVARAAGATAALAGGAYLLSKGGRKPLGADRMLPGAGGTGQRGGALVKTNQRGYDAGSGGLAGRRKLSVRDRAANLGRSARKQGKRVVNAARNTAGRAKQRLRSKSY